MACSMDVMELNKAVKGEILSLVNSSFKGVGTDTRQDLRGQLFIALRGDSFDAHDFISESLKAPVILIDCLTDGAVSILGKKTVILVEDTLVALQSLGSYWRTKLKTPILAITGSNGKTSTKEFATTLLAEGLNVHASRGSFNNHWGVPISLLQLSPEHNACVLEMGMNHSGEIKKLCEIAHPDVVMVTMVGTSHIGFLGSQEKVAEAKEEIYKYSKAHTKIFNLDNPFTRKMFEKYKDSGAHLCFSQSDPEAEIRFQLVESSLNDLTLKGVINGVSGQAKVPVFGEHNIVNLMAASAGALALGQRPEIIWNRLAECHSAWGRNQLFKYKKEIDVLFDAYNANPESMSALLKNITNIEPAGGKIAILGEMGELGGESESAHRELAEKVAQGGFSGVWFVGPSNKIFESALRASGFKNNLLLSDSYNESLDRQVQNMLNPGDIVVIKGSRFNKLEKILDSWRAHIEPQ